MLVILVHHANASFPSEVTDDGIVSELNLQLKNASFPIVVTPEGIVTGGRLVQSRKADAGKFGAALEKGSGNGCHVDAGPKGGGSQITAVAEHAGSHGCHAGRDGDRR